MHEEEFQHLSSDVIKLLSQKHKLILTSAGVCWDTIHNERLDPDLPETVLVRKR